MAWVCTALAVLLVVTWGYLYYLRRSRQGSGFTYSSEQAEKERERIKEHAESFRDRLKEESEKAGDRIDDFFDD